MAMELTSDLEEYIELHTEKEPEILARLSRATHQKILRPRGLCIPLTLMTK